MVHVKSNAFLLRVPYVEFYLVKANYAPSPQALNIFCDQSLSSPSPTFAIRASKKLEPFSFFSFDFLLDLFFFPESPGVSTVGCWSPSYFWRSVDGSRGVLFHHLSKSLFPSFSFTVISTLFLLSVSLETIISASFALFLNLLCTRW